MKQRVATLYEILESLPIGVQITEVNAVTIVLSDATWAGFFDGNAKFISPNGAVYIPVSKIQYINVKRLL
ncbi:hypothetical protein SAMN05216378_0619 [Paenibacillus catalpae]|uniref:Uncharacterized protein n=1 Tax=Paenibacillus catalpae TaxID=1045775 RepID=A0A1I1TPU8_9BACL|nr:hypothetical protein [Paenibacillus catalpae]SFD60564.1 hypothetical protein SAMN05216378_0619 [Paenibacillus catalpae]